MIPFITISLPFVPLRRSNVFITVLEVRKKGFDHYLYQIRWVVLREYSGFDGNNC